MALPSLTVDQELTVLAELRALRPDARIWADRFFSCMAFCAEPKDPEADGHHWFVMSSDLEKFRAWLKAAPK